MELFKGLTQEEIKELRSVIIDIGLFIEFNRFTDNNWKDFVYDILQTKLSLILYKNITKLFHKTNQEIETIIQGVLHE